ncbi:hypothetical protein [Methylobacterium symbioticum]|uniref:hypothetical protein n=1 Tax=Methylobacterium symbioticum TaxID=2584084 RepID=UPI001626A707|nr:hypothetical protein [Methylobacterium symbioticum]
MGAASAFGAAWRTATRRTRGKGASADSTATGSGSATGGGTKLGKIRRGSGRSAPEAGAASNKRAADRSDLFSRSAARTGRKAGAWRPRALVSTVNDRRTRLRDIVGSDLSIGKTRVRAANDMERNGQNVEDFLTDHLQKSGFDAEERLFSRP